MLTQVFGQEWYYSQRAGHIVEHKWWLGSCYNQEGLLLIYQPRRYTHICQLRRRRKRFPGQGRSHSIPI